MEYILQNSELRVVIHVINQDEKTLPYACGLHPGFAWPLPGGEGRHFLRFDEVERTQVPVIAPGGLFSTQNRAIAFDGRELPLSEELFVEALCFLDARSQGVTLHAGAGAKPCLRMELENFPHIALWSRPGGKFLCLEAWTGHGDPENFNGDIFEKPSMRLLAPGESSRCAATFTWRA